MTNETPARDATLPIDDVAQLADRLVDSLRSFEGVAVALSGGVDSAVVAQAAFTALGARAIAVTAHSPSVGRRDREAAAAVAKAIGMQQLIVEPEEFADAAYVANRGDRCFYCKSHLYDVMAAACRRHGVAMMCNGTNVDDLGDFRPGLRAASDFAVRSPLAECGLTKSDVRRLATYWSLPVADRPASPCLASRLAVGVEATPERMRRVEEAEEWLRSRLPLRSDFRVRIEAGELARIEVPIDTIAALTTEECRTSLVDAFRKLGFRAITLDLAGFQSGSLNSLVPLEVRRAASARGNAVANPQELPDLDSAESVGLRQDDLPA